MRPALLPVFVAILAVLVAGGGVRAADMEVMDVLGQAISVVSVRGDLAEGDGAKFAELVAGLDRASVMLEGGGGADREALTVGAEIQAKGFATVVLPGMPCTSACALAWVSGVRRYMSKDSAVGFNAAYREQDGVLAESGVANAEIGSFLTHLGLRIEAIRFMTIGKVDAPMMLTPEIARKVGIEIFEQDGLAVTPPQDAPTADLYVGRFVSYSYINARCLPFFAPDAGAIDRGVRAAFEEGNRIVGSGNWVELWTPRFDFVKSRIEADGTLPLCLEAEADLRAQGQPTGIDGPSFDCGQASTPTETAICGDRDLWPKDRAMTAIYFWVREHADAPTRKSVLEAQRAWLKARNACGGDASCLRHVYDTRFSKLKGIELV